MGKESTFGTLTTPDSFIPFTGNSMNVDPGFFMPETMVGFRDTGVFPLFGQEKDVGSIEAPLFPTNGIELLVYSIGTDVVSGSGPLYTHTISQANLVPSVTIEKNLGDYQSIQFGGARVNKFSIKASADDTAATFTADMVAQSFAILNTPTTVVFDEEFPFVFAEYQLTWNNMVLAQATNFTLDIDNGVKAVYAMNGYHQAQFVPATHLKVSGTFDVVWDSLTDPIYGYFSQMINQIDAQLVFTLSHPSSGGSISITMPHVKLTKDVIDPKVADVMMENISFTAHRYIGTQSTISAVIQNSRSTAY